MPVFGGRADGDGIAALLDEGAGGTLDGGTATLLLVVAGGGGGGGRLVGDGGGGGGADDDDTCRPQEPYWAWQPTRGSQKVWPTPQ